MIIHPFQTVKFKSYQQYFTNKNPSTQTSQFFIILNINRQNHKNYIKICLIIAVKSWENMIFFMNKIYQNLIIFNCLCSKLLNNFFINEWWKNSDECLF
jgi:hypothetical protein